MELRSAPTASASPPAAQVGCRSMRWISTICSLWPESESPALISLRMNACAISKGRPALHCREAKERNRNTISDHAQLDWRFHVVCGRHCCRNFSDAAWLGPAEPESGAASESRRHFCEGLRRIHALLHPNDGFQRSVHD